MQCNSLLVQLALLVQSFMKQLLSWSCPEMSGHNSEPIFTLLLLVQFRGRKSFFLYKSNYHSDKRSDVISQYWWLIKTQRRSKTSLSEYNIVVPMKYSNSTYSSILYLEVREKTVLLRIFKEKITENVFLWVTPVHDFSNLVRIFRYLVDGNTIGIICLAIFLKEHKTQARTSSTIRRHSGEAKLKYVHAIHTIRW